MAVSFVHRRASWARMNRIDEVMFWRSIGAVLVIFTEEISVGELSILGILNGIFLQSDFLILEARQ
jgi:hypothetical protein